MTSAWRPLSAAVLASLALTACTASDGSSDAPPEPHSGPAWEAYKDGRGFGSKHQDEGLPSLAVDPSEGVTTDTYDVNSDTAEKWCEENLPDELWSKHTGHPEALTDGCVGGVYPAADHPDELLPFDD